MKGEAAATTASAPETRMDQKTAESALVGSGLKEKTRRRSPTEDGALSDKPLERSPVEKNRNNGDEEDDGRKDADEEPGKFSDVGIGKKGDAELREAEQLTRQLRDEAEDGVAGAGA